MRTQSLWVVLAIVLARPTSSAQWARTDLPYQAPVSAFAVSDTYIFAGTMRGVFLFTNNGTSWTQTGDWRISARAVRRA